MPEQVNIDSKMRSVVANSSATDFHLMCIYQGVVPNNPPQIESPILVNIIQGNSYTFTSNIIIDNLVDTESDDILSIKIIEVPPNGILTIGDVQIINNQVIPWNLFNQIVWTPVGDDYGVGHSVIKIVVIDDGIPPRCYSNVIDIVFNILPINQEPTVMDNLVETEFGSTLTLLPSFFTLNYYDPEGDSLGHILITSIPPLEKGRLILDNNNINQEDLPLMVTATQLLAEELVYQDTNSIIEQKLIEIEFSIFDDNN